MKLTHYEVYARSVYGSDVLEFDTYEEALKAAQEWQLKTKDKVVIAKVDEEWIEWQ